MIDPHTSIEKAFEKYFADANPNGILLTNIDLIRDAFLTGARFRDGKLLIAIHGIQKIIQEIETQRMHEIGDTEPTPGTAYCTATSILLRQLLKSLGDVYSET